MSPIAPTPARSVAIERPCLYVVATPIGNLGDITLRAIEVLGACDLILAEDTRTTAALLGHFGIGTPTSALHEHNERAVAPALVKRMREDGLAVALVSDAGTPLLSDPGYPLLQATIADGIPVHALPGPSALLAGLAIGGLPTDRFCFEGFLPPKAVAARARLDALAHEPRTLVFYESPRRVRQTLALMVQAWGGERLACAARELTKLHESVYRGSLEAVLAAIGQDSHGEKGEYVLMVAGAPAATADLVEIRRVLALLQRHVSARSAIELAAEILHRPRNEVYALAVGAASAPD